MNKPRIDEEKLNTWEHLKNIIILGVIVSIFDAIISFFGNFIFLFLKDLFFSLSQTSNTLISFDQNFVQLCFTVFCYLIFFILLFKFRSKIFFPNQHSLIKTNRHVLIYLLIILFTLELVQVFLNTIRSHQIYFSLELVLSDLDFYPLPLRRLASKASVLAITWSVFDLMAQKFELSKLKLKLSNKIIALHSLIIFLSVLILLISIFTVQSPLNKVGAEREEFLKRTDISQNFLKGSSSDFPNFFSSKPNDNTSESSISLNNNFQGEITDNNKVMDCGLSLDFDKSKFVMYTYYIDDLNLEGQNNPAYKNKYSISVFPKESGSTLIFIECYPSFNKDIFATLINNSVNAQNVNLDELEFLSEQTKNSLDLNYSKKVTEPLNLTQEFYYIIKVGDKLAVIWNYQIDPQVKVDISP